MEQCKFIVKKFAVKINIMKLIELLKITDIIKEKQILNLI